MPTLNDICRYYLACLGQGDVGVSVDARKNNGEPDYGELISLPENTEDLLKDESYGRLRNVVRGERSHLAMYVGYPTCIIKRKNFRGEYSRMVEPFLLFPVELDDPPHLDISFPIINQKTFKSYTHADNSEEIMNELVQLEAALEINNEINIGALAKKLKDIRSQWPWQEKINQTVLTEKLV